MSGGFSLLSAIGRDGHTHWVMDIQSYPIQMFRVIPGSSWVEFNRIGYEYYLNCSCRVWILSNPTCIKKKKKTLNLSHHHSHSLYLQTRAIDLLFSLPNPSKHVSWSVIVALIHHVCESLILASVNTFSPWPTSISTTLYL